MVTVIAIGASTLALASLASAFVLKGMNDASKHKVSELTESLEDQSMILSALQAHADELENRCNELMLEMARRSEQRKADKKKAAAKMKSTKVEAVVAEPTTTKKRKYTKKSN